MSQVSDAFSKIINRAIQPAAEKSSRLSRAGFGPEQPLRQLISRIPVLGKHLDPEAFKHSQDSPETAFDEAGKAAKELADRLKELTKAIPAALGAMTRHSLLSSLMPKQSALRPWAPPGAVKLVDPKLPLHHYVPTAKAVNPIKLAGEDMVGAASGAAGAAEGAASALGSVAMVGLQVGNAFAIATHAAIAVPSALIGIVSASKLLAETMYENNRWMAQYSGATAAAYAQTDIAQILRKRTFAENMSQSTTAAAFAVDKMRDAFEPTNQLLQAIQNALAVGAAQIVTGTFEIINGLAPIKELTATIQRALAKFSPPPTLPPWELLIRQGADKMMARGKPKQP